ncbi:MAG TPA: hypothetical protein VLB45_00925, partial [Nitrosopumilaceae archaeon]|nr:hypothetical protein [Nitrosopumilaceae archaeon]
EKKQGFHIQEFYDIAPEIAEKMGVERKAKLGITKKSAASIQHLKEISEAIQDAKSSIEKSDVEQTLANLDVFIEPSKKGPQMIEYFFEEHREIRLHRIRIKDRGIEYLQANKQKILEFFDSMEANITKKLRSTVAQN